MTTLPPAITSRSSRLAGAKLSAAALGPYLNLAIAMTAATAAAAALRGLIPNHSLAMVFLPAVLICSVLHGRNLGIAAAIIAFLAYDILFLPPRFTFSFEPISTTLTLAVFLAVALLTGTLAGRVRDQARETSARASTMTVLFNASHALGSSSSRAALADILAAEVARVAHGEVHVFLRQAETIAWTASSLRGGAVSGVGIAGIAARAWARINSGEVLAGAMQVVDQFTAHSLGTAQRPLGVLLRTRGEPATSLAEAQTIAILCELGSIALERADLMDEMTRAQVLAEGDKLRSALLSSISHDFRTPLAGILAASTALIDQGEKFSRDTALDLLADIRDQAERANRYVANLLHMMKLNAGAIQAKLEPTDVVDIIGAAATRCRPAKDGARSEWLRCPADSCLVEADPVLLEQALYNVLDNAVQYSDRKTPVDVSLHVGAELAEIVISDDGPGIPANDLERIFDKFYRAPSVEGRVEGTGLGLSIARGLVEAMGGTVRARSPVRRGRGTAIHLGLKRLHES